MEIKFINGKYRCPFCMQSRKQLPYMEAHVAQCKDDPSFRYPESEMVFVTKEEIEDGVSISQGMWNSFTGKIGESNGATFFLMYFKTTLLKKRCHFSIKNSDGIIVYDNTFGSNSWSKMNDMIREKVKKFCKK